MEVTDALRVPLEPAQVRMALGDLALLRASLDNCETFVRLAGGEYALTLVVPLGALRARYAVRAHLARGSMHDDPAVDAHLLSFKARGAGVGSLRGQIDVVLVPDSNGKSTWIEYTLWATLAGPLAGLPARQIENALREGADDFFAEFCEVVRAKHGMPSLRAAGESTARRHVFLRPGAMSMAFSRRPGAPRGLAANAHASGVLRHRLHGHGFGHPER